MNACKEFMHRIRRVNYKDVYLVLDRDIIPQLTEYVCLIEQVKFEDGFYQDYYGDVKKLITSFLTFWKYVIDDIIQEADKCSNVIDRDQLLIIMDRTIDIHQERQIAFGKGFLPVRSPLEKQTYEEIELLYNEYMEKLCDLKGQIEKMDKQEKVDNFVSDHFKITVRGTSELFETTHLFLAMMLADRLNQIRVSLEEILQRLKNNLRDVREESERSHVKLVAQLYEKNKELLQICRQDRTSSIDCAETGHSIDMIRSKIEEGSFDTPIFRLEEEVTYMERRLRDFRECTDELFTLKKEQDNVIKQEEIYRTMRTTELPGSKRQCWLRMGENFEQRRLYLKDKIIEVAKTLITFFGVQGFDRILYTDNLGKYFVDEYKHQTYVFNYGMGLYHRTCEGDFKQIPTNNLYYIDKFGRYVLNERGEKRYQVAPCTSQYELVSGDLLRKTGADCGHSERARQTCRLVCRDKERPGELVPDIEPIDIQSTLQPEAVRYLWASLGHVLPRALRDVGEQRTRNPIQYLAHKLLVHKKRWQLVAHGKRSRRRAASPRSPTCAMRPKQPPRSMRKPRSLTLSIEPPTIDATAYKVERPMRVFAYEKFMRWQDVYIKAIHTAFFKRAYRALVSSFFENIFFLMIFVLTHGATASHEVTATLLIIPKPL